MTLRVLERGADLATRLAGLLLADLGCEVYADAPPDPILDRGKRRGQCDEPDIALLAPGTTAEAATVVHVEGEWADASLLAEALGGLMYQQRDDDPRPYPLGEPVPAVCAALLACIGALAGRGVVRTSYLEGALAAQCMSGSFLPGASTAIPEERYRNGLSVGMTPAVHFHEAADGWLMTGAPTRARWRALLTLVGREDLIESEALSAAPLGFIPHDAGSEVTAAVAAFVRSLPVEEAVERLRAGGVLAAPVLTQAEFLRHPQAAELLVSLDDGATGIGNVIRIESLGVPNRATSLAGLKVVEIAGFVAGPMAGRVLADLGADVVKVEPPGGDELRPVGLAFSVANRGKRSIALDTRTPEGRETLARLLETADMLVSNHTPERERTLGIDDEAVRARWPHLVKLQLSAYGVGGPLSGLPAIDAAVQAVTGLAMARGGGVRPAGFTGAILDCGGGYLGALGALAALQRGEGAIVRTSLLNLAALLQITSLVDPPERAAPRLGPARDGFDAFQRLYPTTDGWVCLASGSEEEARHALLALDLETPDGELLRAPVDGELAQRIAAAVAGLHSESVVRAVPACMAVRTLDSWRDTEPLFAAVEQEPFGTLRQVGTLLRFASDDARELRGAPALVSADGQAVLRDWGISGSALPPTTVTSRATNL